MANNIANNLTETFQNIFLAGVGALSIGGEKAKAVIDDLVERGQVTVDQGRKINEELKHKVDQAVKEHVHVTVVKEEAAEPKAEDLLNAVDKLTPEELAALKKKLNEMEKTDECQCDTDEEE